MQSLESIYEKNLTFFEKAGIFPRLKQASPSELKTPINKKGELVEKSIRNYVSTTEAKPSNQRIQHKVESIRKKILDYLVVHNESEIVSARKFLA